METMQQIDANANPPREGEVTKTLEGITSRIPSLAYLGLAVGSMAASAALALFTKKKTIANFIGLWVPSIMLVGVYNKLVKLEGSDRQKTDEGGYIH
jgi:hypothetical protein